MIARMEGQPARTDRRPRWVPLGLLALLFCVATLLLYRPVLGTPLFSDDNLYSIGNPWVAEFSLRQLPDFFDPSVDVHKLVINFAPATLLLHTATWSAFGPWPLGHHLTNLLLHALVSMLLVVLLRRAGLSDRLAAFGGLVFLLHPANAEVAAWASQLKTLAATAMGMGALLLLLGRRFALATLVYGLGLLFKASAGFALPVGAIWLWTRATGAAGDLERRQALYLTGWALLTGLYLVAQLEVVSNAVGRFPEVTTDPWQQLRFSVSLVARYLTMATTSYGVSAFQEPPLDTSPLDPWWLGGLAILFVLGARTLWALRERRTEAAWWVWAIVSFLPVCQVVPFAFPIADRYLYAILPGLIGGALLAGRDLAERLQLPARTRVRAAAAIGIAFAVVLAGRTWQRAQVWSMPEQLAYEAVINFPGGARAALFDSQRSLLRYDHAGAVAALRRAYGLGHRSIGELAGEPYRSALGRRRDYRALIEEVGHWWVDAYQRKGELSELDLLSLGMTYEILGNRAAARETYQRAVELEGVYEARLRAQLAALSP